MKLVSYEEGGARVGVVLGDGDGDGDGDAAVHDVLLDGQPWSTGMGGLIRASGGDLGRLTPAATAKDALAQYRLIAPVPRPSKIVAAPVNYFDHKAEMNEATHIDGLGVFLKAPSSLIGNEAVIRLPYDDRRFDQEGELAFVIGRTARNVTVESATDYIFGYTCLLDITMRGGEDRSTRKSFDTFTPMGPFLVTPDAVGEVEKLRLVCAVNDVVRQDAVVGDLIWNVSALLAYASSVMTLLPGDVLTTGTPAGIGRIHHGDTVSVMIDRIGTLTVSVDATGAVTCPTKGAQSGPVPPQEVTPLRATLTAQPQGQPL